ncbi:hypothetical protein niasHT_000635 [Heterodera trifolii]|uniref:protein-disulfide reductase n=1 Tax=Heterodera trifolii TaxID=157864 RepID=A0ABD2MBX1_9BILA
MGIHPFCNIGLLRKSDDKSLINGQLALKGCEIMALYFGAHMCQRCREFIPVLKQFYDQLKKASETVPFEIVFVPFDHSEDEFRNSLRDLHDDWLYIPYGSVHINSLAAKFNIINWGVIPTLVVLKQDGTLITMAGQANVQYLSASDAMSYWRSL